MKRKPWLWVAMLAVGTALLVTAGVASPASSAPAQSSGTTAKRGGTLRLSKSTDIDYVDPALAYFTDSFGQLEYATGARLFNYPDKSGAPGTQVIPEMVKSYTVSKDGKTYTFRLYNTFKYNTGKTVGAADYVYALNRDANPKMQSPATAYMHEIVGADAVIDGKAKSIAGVTAPSKFVLKVRLTKALPDFLSRMTLPFYMPLPPGTPINPDGIDNPPSAGPYYVASRVVNRQIVLKRNPYYKGKRAANPDQIIYSVGASLAACQLETEQNSVDYCVDGIPPAAYKEVADKYGINKGQFYVNHTLGTSYFALNQDRAAFKNNLSLRKAMNFAIDRPALVRAGGFLSGQRTDQILPPAMTQDVNIYPIKGAAPKIAEKYAKGHMPSGNSLVLYTANRGARVIRAQVLQFDLKQIGINLQITQFARAVEHQKCGVRGEPFDICDEGWIVDYPDPITFFDPLLQGTNIHDTQNTNESYQNDPKWNKLIAAAGRLSGPARRKAYANLDINMTKNDAPWASFLTINQNDFLSKSTGCYVFNPVWWFDWAAACKK